MKLFLKQSFKRDHPPILAMLSQDMKVKINNTLNFK